MTAWLKEVKHAFPTLGPWERRAFVIASYFMDDEGQFWRQHFTGAADPYERLLMNWMDLKRIEETHWELPL